ncbi:pentapeptide repeat-containing protein [Vibrio alginolyticus]|uniref:pentapeptide repeat-containing protein n=1 Tax=Vibrio harveyi group TaxID=717610 RepID=UPI00044E6C64|nr:MULTISPECIES: pentapeptide repeat-containing protein [Vibrio harveyi group]EJG1687814.1 pentapeptide repeat-containing protein [Vibrio parahaemolyticus]EVT77424.1 pentapeptide repeats family protein [Vibrio parahaemolyticus V14/01]MBE3685599.1 pentapeptide repeat-containing protein [Vibrio parahaemolyticus]MBM5414094.1 pentapeptide repeat-containing protein [Vibrio parahaemolyticus]MBM5454703.1 pentapeptide repeat-containing protein [Vibrio parahaemolyticus]
MASEQVLEILKSGAENWNKWRLTEEGRRADLSDVDFVRACPSDGGFYDLPEFQGFDFSHMNLNRVSMRNSTFIECDFTDSHFHFSDLVDSYCLKCNFSGAGLNVSKIGSANFIECNFTGADLSYCSAEETNFTGSYLVNTNLSNMSLVKTNFSNARIENSCAYGISAWDLVLNDCKQSNIAISETSNSITVPTIELAQFISLLIKSKNLRQVIETITSKVVLILGRFTPERKAVLDEIKSQLDEHGYLAVLFDFEVPSSRDITETVITLAALSKFIVADLSDPRSIPQELTSIVPHLPSVPVQPILELDDQEYGMFEHFKNYPWVLPIKTYVSSDLSSLVEQVVLSCEEHLES